MLRLQNGEGQGTAVIHPKFKLENLLVQCDGNTPCARCVAKDVQCVYRSDEDGRSRVPVKRKLEQLEHDNAVLHRIFDAIREADSVQAGQMISLIRGNASIPEIHNFLSTSGQSASQSHQGVSPPLTRTYPNTETMPSRTQTPMTPSPQFPAAAESISKHMDLNRLVDEPIYRVPAHPWTGVTSDDQVVSHLVSLWATWENFPPHGIVLELFLRDMRSENLDSYFCSPFLANCILAAGCPHSDYAEIKPTQGVASALMNSFIHEAKEHLARDPSMPSVTLVQGLCVLAGAVAKMYQDREGYHYVNQAVSMCEELSRAREWMVQLAPTLEAKTELAYGLDIACWECFCFTTAYKMGWMRPQNTTPPNAALPTSSGAVSKYSTSRWSPYPRQGEFQDVQTHELRSHHVSLAVLTAEVTRAIHKYQGQRGDVLAAEAFHRLYVRLILWHRQLPEHFKHPSPKCPFILAVRVWWHNVILGLLGAKLRAMVPSESVEDDSGGGENPTKGKHVAAPATSTARSEENELIKHALDVVALGKVYNTHFDGSRPASSLIQASCPALCVLLEQNVGRRYDSEITELFLLLRAASRRFPLAFALLRTLQIHFRQNKIDLPMATDEVLQDFEQRNVSIRSQRRPNDSLYPCPQLFFERHNRQQEESGTAVQPTNLGEFLEMFDRLELEPKS